MLNYFFRSTLRVFCRLSMLASSAASPSLKFCSSCVLNVDQEFMLQSEAKELISQEEKVFSITEGRPVDADWTPILRHWRACWDCTSWVFRPLFFRFKWSETQSRTSFFTSWTWSPSEKSSFTKARPIYFTPTWAPTSSLWFLDVISSLHWVSGLLWATPEASCPTGVSLKGANVVRFRSSNWATFSAMVSRVGLCIYGEQTGTKFSFPTLVCPGEAGCNVWDLQ